VFLITPCLQPYKHIMNLTLVFFLIGFIDNLLFLFLNLKPVSSEGKNVNHIFAKHKLAWCCLQCCMIGACNILVTMQLIEVVNQMDYLHLDIHDYLISQMI
jgi:hypothetical protein